MVEVNNGLNNGFSQYGNFNISSICSLSLNQIVDVNKKEYFSSLKYGNDNISSIWLAVFPNRWCQ